MQKLTETVLEKSDTGTFTLMEAARWVGGSSNHAYPVDATSADLHPGCFDLTGKPWGSRQARDGASMPVVIRRPLPARSCAGVE